MMRTEIRTFCDEYAEKLECLSGDLNKAVRAMPLDSAPLLKRWRLRLQEVFHRTGNLNDKIAQQHAYLLIFGPLKSGKSTLMNAISGSYVSEVSSLPAYPALVNVRHGEKRAFQATTYSGERLEFDNSQSMADAVVKGHEELARRILEVERTGEAFDPQTHYPKAIRQMDVQIPAEALAESGSVLVDTPGLYTRMRFGYDVMTRDFRDTASCAIFVVKSDNLFFEKVFEEFNQLLGHFSRIFLVVNIDSSKRDLNADGSLVPSLESRNPEAIIDAFQSLAMSAPLREAYEKGSLNVYPIDLLKAASSELKRNAGLAHEADEAVEDGFNHFLGDLTDYLNSSDYLREFMHDSLRVGENLKGEVASVASGEASDRLREEAERCSTRLAEAKSRLVALETLERIDWDAAFEEINKEKERLLDELSDKTRDSLVTALNDVLDNWLKSDDSLRALRDDYLNPHIERETADDGRFILDRLRERMDTKDGGARFSADQARAFERAQLRMESIAPKSLSELGSEEAPKPPPLELAPEEVPIKRSFMDYLLFRSKKNIRQRFFGPQGTDFIASDKKRKRIAGKQLETFRERIVNYPQEVLPQVQRDYVNRLFGSYVESLSKALQQQCEELKAESIKRKSECEDELKSNREVQLVFDQLTRANRTFEEALNVLKGRYGAEFHSDDQDGVEGSSEPTAEAGETREEARESDEALALDGEDLEAAREPLKRADSDLKADRE